MIRDVDISYGLPRATATFTERPGTRSPVDYRSRFPRRFSCSRLGQLIIGINFPVKLQERRGVRKTRRNARCNSEPCKTTEKFRTDRGVLCRIRVAEDRSEHYNSKTTFIAPGIIESLIADNFITRKLTLFTYRFLLSRNETR